MDFNKICYLIFKCSKLSFVALTGIYVLFATQGMNEPTLLNVIILNLYSLSMIVIIIYYALEIVIELRTKEVQER